MTGAGVRGGATGARVVAGVLAGTVAAALLAGCAGTSAQEQAARGFLDAWARGDVAAAANATDDPAAASATLAATATTLPRGSGTLTVTGTGDDGTVAYDASWPVAGVTEPWRYAGRVAVVAGPGGAWRVRWQPENLHPDLHRDRTLTLDRRLPQRAALLDATGAPLVRPTETVQVAIVPARTPDLPAVANALAGALGIDAGDIVADAALARPDAAVPVITLRRPDYDTVRDRVRDLPGTVFRTGIDQLGPTPRFAQPLLGQVDRPTAEELDRAGPAFTATDDIGTSGLQEAFNRELAGTAGATIDVVDTGGTSTARLLTVAPRPGAAVTTTLDTRVQQAAEAALAGVAPAATVVAVQPSTGAIRAVATTAAAPFVIGLAGRYPPGSTFKIVTAAAALQAGAVRPDDPVACPGTTTVGGRVVPNEDGFALGTVPFRTAVARSCNTTFAELSQRIGDPAIAEAAARFGIGAGWELPVDSFDGSYRPGADPAATAANAFGQGTDLVSPLSEALIAATVARGSVPVPVLVPVRPTGVARPAAAPSPAAVEGLRSMLRDVVTDGTAPELAAVPGGPVAGKTGTAEHGTGGPGGGPLAHSWFTGYQGDLAFAVFVEDGQTGGVPANPIAARFLTALPR